MITGRVAKWPWRRCDFPRTSLASVWHARSILAPSQPTGNPKKRKKKSRAKQKIRQKHGSAKTKHLPTARPARLPSASRARLLPPYPSRGLPLGLVRSWEYKGINSGRQPRDNL